MGRYSGNGMGPAFQVFWPFVDRSRITKAEAKKLREREDEAAAATRKVGRLRTLDVRIGRLVRRAEAEGMRPPEILKVLEAEIREAERRDRALKTAEA